MTSLCVELPESYYLNFMKNVLVLKSLICSLISLGVVMRL